MSRRLDPENFDAEKFAWSQRIMHDPAVSPAAKSVVGLLMHDLNPCVGGAWRSQDSIAARLGLSDRHVRRLLKQLETAAYLQIEVRKGRSRTNIYRATLPDDARGALEKRTSTTDQTREKRTQEAVQTPKKRTSTSRKPDMGDRQFLYEPINRFRTAEHRGPNGSAGTPARVTPFAQAAVRQAVVQIAGESAAVSYLDRAKWEPDERRILCTSPTAFTRLKDLVGRPPAARCSSIALQPRETRQLAA